MRAMFAVQIVKDPHGAKASAPHGKFVCALTGR
jgi:hypothetical protein